MRFLLGGGGGGFVGCQLVRCQLVKCHSGSFGGSDGTGKEYPPHRRLVGLKQQAHMETNQILSVLQIV